MEKIQLTEEQKKRFAGIYVLDYMLHAKEEIPVFLEGGNVDLEPVLEWLMSKDYILIENQEKYKVSQSGKELLKKFMERYTDYLKIYDIFSYVDLTEGEFAFESYFDYDTDEDWKEYLDDQRWDDLRIAVAEFKKIDPVEIVFMSFINESRFGRDSEGWQFDLLLGSVWDDIVEICETAIHCDELGYEDDEEEVSSEDVILDIIEQGSEIMLELIKQENGMRLENSLSGENTIEDEEIEERPISYYESYSDPYYVSPSWHYVW